MGDVVVGRETVGEHIELLEERYGRFSRNQTTMTVPARGYRRARERATAGSIDAYVRVRNDEGEAFHMRCEEAFAIGDANATMESRIGAAVRAATGLDVTVRDVTRVTIAGIRNEADPDAETIYRLFVLFDADLLDGAPVDVEWDGEASEVPGFVGGV